MANFDDLFTAPTATETQSDRPQLTKEEYHLFSVRIHSARGRSERSGGHTGVVLHWRADF